MAIKFITLGSRFYPRYVEREIINHRRLAHPHIVALKEVFVTRQHLAIVMEYVGGGNLQQYVERAGRLPEWQARCFSQQVRGRGAGAAAAPGGRGGWRQQQQGRGRW